MNRYTAMNQTSRFSLNFFMLLLLAAAASSCGDDPTPVNEEEVVTTVTVTLTPSGGGMPITLKFYDADGDGSVAPVKTISGNLSANKTYAGVITLLNESQPAVVDITAEVKAESDDHLFCFTVNGGNLSVIATDTDSKGLPIGLSSSWTTTSPGNATVSIALRHQFQTKTGSCPGDGETDVAVDFNLVVQ